MAGQLLDLDRRPEPLDAADLASISRTAIRLARLAEAAHRYQEVHSDADGLDRCVSLAEHDDLLGRSPAQCVTTARQAYSPGSYRANGLCPRVVVADAARTEAGRRAGAVRTEVNR